jgi:hypothetical protein
MSGYDTTKYEIPGISAMCALLAGSTVSAMLVRAHLAKMLARTQKLGRSRVSTS